MITCGRERCTAGGIKVILDELQHPIIQAPMAGGPSTVALAVAVSNAGGMGFLATGYGRVETMRTQIRELRASTDRPFGINLFVPGSDRYDEVAVERYLHQLAAEERRYGSALGLPRNDDDDWAEFLSVLDEERPPVASFTFGCPTEEELASLRSVGISTWVTITDPAEALVAQRRGADAVIVQGLEAGGHRGGFRDDGDGVELALLSLLRLTRTACELPLIAAGGIADGAALAAALAAGASAAQIGSAFMLADEAATHPAHRERLASGAPTAFTRAFSGRQARGIINRFQSEYSALAPRAYPQIHYATSPLRARARERDDADGFNLWAGQTHTLAQALPAADIVQTLAADARAAVARAAGRLARQPE